MFKSARPVFVAGKEKEMNHQLVLRAFADTLEGTQLYITAASFYRLSVNGEFAFFGPSRAADKYARVDVIDLAKFNLPNGRNEIIIEVAGYYCKSLATVRQPSFVQAELRRGDDVLLATDAEGKGFEGFCNINRVRKADRYSMQRHFNEIWDMRDQNRFADKNRVDLCVTDNRLTYLSSAPEPDFSCVELDAYASRGVYEFDASRKYFENRYSGNKTPESMRKNDWGAYLNEEVEYRPYPWIQRQKTTMTGACGSLPVTVCAGEYAVFDLKMLWAGFLRMSIKANEESDVVLGFSELCSAEEFEFSNINCQNVIEYLLPAGEFLLESFEPYTARYAIVMVKKGSAVISSFGIRKCEFDTSRMIGREFSDEGLRAIYDAGIRAFAHNSVDIYMDCPSRERAGWLCDSFFTSKVEYFLTGKSDIESIFLENYRLYKNESTIIPQGMLPECYPSDIEEDYIPQWNLWYILEVYEYITERAPWVNKELFKDSVYGILGFFARHENSDGLAEKLPGWNFVEWSTANEWVHDVNYPTNFLYAEALERTGKLYGDAKLISKAQKIRETIVEQSFDGEVFIDNAVRDENGVLRNTTNFSEAGQYYAILFGADKVNIYDEKFEKLCTHVMSEFKSFDPEMPNFVTVDCMPGYYLKLLTLIKLGKLDILEASIRSFFAVMVELTGTLWEYKPVRRKGSYDHGFASFGAVAAWLVDSNK